MKTAASTLQRSALTSLRILRRYSSSQGTTSRAPHALSPEKMRALISLYHQTDTFVTPETLSERIDLAFTGRKREDDLMTPLQQASVSTLNYFRRQTELAPKFSEWDQEKAHYRGETWSQSNYSPREWKVVEALYGVDASGRFQPLPGLEALEEGNGGNIGLPPSEVDINESAEASDILTQPPPMKRKKFGKSPKKKGATGFQFEHTLHGF
ncbi:hypothetical protein D9757_000223 [Collybiopsis confluens]|uniref:Uncharacterized protein n=1 Tax=Collybiopsis confluens TaxID=2823264 RepID=A0A8H5I2R7_9AGAR|nr:hypothetical protein D9757_000223 [Collybiopsis confluens]